MGSFQDEIRRIHEDRKAAAQKTVLPSAVEQHRRESESYIDAICDRIRKYIKGKAVIGEVSHDVKLTYKTDRWGNEEDLIERITFCPHYLVPWYARCELDFSEDHFFYDAKECVFYISEHETLFYIYEEVEKRLSSDGIFSVRNKNTENLSSFSRRKICFSKSEKAKFICEDKRHEFIKAFDAYAKGEGPKSVVITITGEFAFFL